MTAPKQEPFQPHPDGRLTTVEEVPSLDASQLAWSGIIERGAEGDMWPFENLAEETGFFADRSPNFEKLELTKLERREHSDSRIWLAAYFKTTQQSDRWGECVSDDWREFTLVSTTPHFGGKRWWFECSHCGKQRAKVYLIPCLYSLCRVCLQLTYETRQAHNRDSRHGSGWRRVRHFMHTIFKNVDLQSRRCLRRRVRRSNKLSRT